MGRPKLTQSELRTKVINARFSDNEYQQLIKIMQECGHDSPSTFLRISGLRSKIPPRIFVPEQDKELINVITYILSEVRDEIYIKGSSDLNQIELGLSELLKLLRERATRHIQSLQTSREK